MGMMGSRPLSITPEPPPSRPWERRGPFQDSLHAWVHVAACLCLCLCAHLSLNGTVGTSLGRSVYNYEAACAVMHTCEAGSVPRLCESACVFVSMHVRLHE